MKGSMFFAAAISMSMACTAHADCLQDAADFAQRICGEVKTTGKSTLITAQGELSAEAKSLLAKALGQFGGRIDGKIETKTFENVLQEQLGPELVNIRQCGIQMAKAAMDQICTRAPVWKTCTNQAFGLSHWANQEKLNGTSGYRGGGYNQGAYCTDFINSVIQGRGLGNQPHLVTDIKSSEESRRTGFAGTGPVEYNYHCSITLHWNPVYNQKADPLCGTE
jgi:hypothetical protein